MPIQHYIIREVYGWRFYNGELRENAARAAGNDHYDCGDSDGHGFFEICEMIVNVL